MIVRIPTEKRIQFENEKWISDKLDKLPRNPLARVKCKRCYGFGVICTGKMVYENFINCPLCHTVELNLTLIDFL